MKRLLQISAFVAMCALASAANATGLATCNSGPPSGWKTQEALTKMLTDRGWQIRRIKIDGGCYEVYAIDEKGERIEAYFHPVTFERIPIADDE